jgi:small subunit ribosomal protein S27e
MPEPQTQERKNTGPDRGTYARIGCADCDNEQVMFARPSNEVSCRVCGSPLAHPTGGLAELEGTFIEYLD